VPGWYEDKIAALIKGLPKRYRRLLVPVAEKAAIVAAEMPRAPEEMPLAKAVAEFVRRRFGVDIPAREWALADVPRYLRMRLAVVDPATGKVIDAGRDVELLRKKLGAADMAPSKVESPAWREACRKWERAGFEDWSFGDLPETVAVGTSLTAYPALKLVDTTVEIRLFATRAEAEASHRKGVRFLLMKKFGKDLAFVRRYHKIPAEYEAAARPFGGREGVERAIEAALARETFERPIRAEAEFKAYGAEVGRTLFEKGHALTQTVLQILAYHAAVRAALRRGGWGVGRPPKRRAFAFAEPAGARPAQGAGGPRVPRADRARPRTPRSHGFPRGLSRRAARPHPALSRGPQDPPRAGPGRSREGPGQGGPGRALRVRARASGGRPPENRK
jgi:ATP-dependent helicase HrpA